MQECSIGPELALLKAGDLLVKSLMPMNLQFCPGWHFSILGPHLSTCRQISAHSHLPREALLTMRHSLSLPKALVFFTTLNQSPSLHYMCKLLLVH